MRNSRLISIVVLLLIMLALALSLSSCSRVGNFFSTDGENAARASEEPIRQPEHEKAERPVQQRP